MRILEARDLAKTFDSVRAVDGLSLAIEPGEVIGLLGPNGAGKTTSLRMLAGILRPDRGAVLVNGIDLQADPLAAKQRIGFLSGDTQLYQRMTPKEMLRYFGRLFGMAEDAISARVEDLVAQFEMAPFAARMCGALSSGQKQRANIARAFLHDPDLLILDEPTAALDIVSGQFIIQAIKRQKGMGRGILLSTHIISEAEYLCDRIVLLDRGRVVDQGTRAELLERSGAANLTDALLAAAGRPTGEVTR